MDQFHEEETGGGKLYNKDIVRILLGYVLKYKRLLGFALFCVAIITAATLTVPYLSKIIIDRYIVKQGYVVNGAIASGRADTDLKRSLSKAVDCGNGSYFLLQSQLSFIPKSLITANIRAGVFSAEKYTLVESPRLTAGVQAKLNRLISDGDARAFPGGRYVLKPARFMSFTNKELLLLRADDIAHISRYVLLMLAAFCVQCIFAYLQIIALMRLSQFSMRDLRRDLYEHILSLEVAYFDRNPIGRLVNRVTNDIETLNEMFSSVLVTLFQDILILTGITAIMFAVNAYLACAVAVTFPLLFVATLVFQIKARTAYRLIRTKIAALNAFLNENISGMRIVQIFVQELKQLNRFRRINGDVYRANIGQLYVYAVFRPLIDFSRWFAVAAVIYVGARFIVEDRVSFGLVVMFLSYIGSFFEPVGDLSEKFDTMQSATAAGEKILAVFNAPVKRERDITTVAAQGETSHRFAGEIVFDHVWFAYEGEEWVLRDVSFRVKPHQTVAIVGETGSGKTTIINLLSRFYTAQRGTISIDGVNVNDIPYEIVRGNIATVMQDVFLFSRTVRENIILNNPYEEQRLAHVLRMTHTDRFIARLHAGMEEKVMERGAAFSAGERQLLAFARALYVDPSILVLDEATSNIDSETERLIKDAIAHLVQGRTSLVIAHRLSTIRNAHSILVIDKGSIVEQGNHATLLAAGGVYHELHNLQFATS
jgi:ATP-binding cassette subfamily B multidrug efflux pump